MAVFNLYEEMRITRKAMSVALDQTFADHGMIDLSPEEGRVLFLVSTKQRATSLMIQQQFGYSKSTVSEILKTLMGRGLIELQSDESDRRKKYIVLTEEGQKRHSIAESCIEEIDQLFFDGFSDDEVASLQSYLKRVQANAERRTK